MNIKDVTQEMVDRWVGLELVVKHCSPILKSDQRKLNEALKHKRKNGWYRVTFTHPSPPDDIVDKFSDWVQILNNEPQCDDYYDLGFEVSHIGRKETR